MKNFNVFIASVLFALGLQAQSYNPTTNEYFTFSTGEKEVFKTIFNQVSAKQVQTAFDEYLKNYKTKLSAVKGVDGEYTVTEAVLSDINPLNTTMAVKITELEGNATLYVHYLTNGKIVSSNNTPSEFGGYATFTKAIANKAVFVAFDDKIKAENNVLNEREKELKSLEKDEEKQHDAIGKANKSIKDSQSAISALQGTLKNQQAAVAAKAKQVSDKNNEIASVNVKTLESNIKDLEKTNAGIIKEKDKAREEMAKINGRIIKP